ncbi:MAG: hypothetical protein RR765_11330 [Peptostreptococcaceae bacterium]
MADFVNQSEKLTDVIESEGNKLRTILKEKGVEASATDKIPILIDKVKSLENYNKPPMVSDVVVSNVKTSGTYTLEYTIEDSDSDSFVHKLKIGTLSWINIAPIKNGNKYTYNGAGLSQNTQYSCLIEIVDKSKFVQKAFIINVPRPSLYGVRVDESNSNPSTCVTYIEGAIGKAVATSTDFGGWKDVYPFNKIRPCGFKSGSVVKYIDPADFSRYEDGTYVGSDVDVMIEFPKIYWKFTSVSNGYEIRVSNIKVDDDYLCPAHTIGNREVDNIYIGAYLGSINGGKLRSARTQTPKVSQTIGAFRNQAQANGAGYQQWNYYSMFMLQILYLIMYKNLDSQTALGRGVTNPSSIMATGGTYNKGMIFGEATGGLQMKFLGVEDFWGNLYQWVDGYFFNSNRKMLISDNSVFNDTGVSYVDCGQGNTSNVSGSIKKIHGGTKTGFAIKESGGSTSTYYSDYGYLYANRLPISGGNQSDYLFSGAFQFMVDSSASNSYSSISSRLVYLG